MYSLSIRESTHLAKSYPSSTFRIPTSSSMFQSFIFSIVCFFN